VGALQRVLFDDFIFLSAEHFRFLENLIRGADFPDVVENSADPQRLLVVLGKPSAAPTLQAK
jgi:hypothetical protein